MTYWRGIGVVQQGVILPHQGCVSTDHQLKIYNGVPLRVGLL